MVSSRIYIPILMAAIGLGLGLSDVKLFPSRESRVYQVSQLPGLCAFDGKLFREGETVEDPDGCNTCRCAASPVGDTSDWACTVLGCDGDGSGSGESFETKTRPRLIRPGSI